MNWLLFLFLLISRGCLLPNFASAFALGRIKHVKKLSFLATCDATSKATATTNDGSHSPWKEIWIDEHAKVLLNATKNDSPTMLNMPPPNGSAAGAMAAAAQIAERIQRGQSVIMLHDIVPPLECQHLAQLCIEAASEVHRSELECADGKLPTLVRLPSQAAARRAVRDKITCADPLPVHVDDCVQGILLRVCQAIDEHLPSLSQTLFDTYSLTDLWQDSASFGDPQEDALAFSAREPAINVYSAPNGEFLPHKDGETLTVLLPLSSPAVDFQGRGTAFWSSNAQTSITDSSIALAPTAGTALLFGGCVTHAGMPVTDGKRVVLVCSFTRCNASSNQHEGSMEGATKIGGDDEDALSMLLQNAAADWHEKWTSSELHDSCPDM